MKTTIINRNQENVLLACEIDFCLQYLIAKTNYIASKTAQKGAAQEPDYIALLSLCFPHHLATILKSHTSLFQNCSVTGVFCHQKPKASINVNAPDFNNLFSSWGASQSWRTPQPQFSNPEFGDLLLVYVEHPSNGSIPKINSLLLQAKKVVSFEKKVPKSERHQLFLYTKWPTFSYDSAGRLNGQSRDIHPKAIHSGAEYLLIGKESMKCAVPDFHLYGDKTLSDKIVDLLRFRAGRTIDVHNALSSDDWSKLIWDLLSICKNVTANRSNIGLNDFPRYVEDIVQGGNMLDFTEDAAWTSSSEQPPSIFNGIDSAEGNNEISGVSAIIIENHIENM